MASRRRTTNGGIKPENLPTEVQEIKMPLPSSPPSPRRASLPSLTEGLLLSIFPITLLLGSLFSHLSPSLRPPSNASIYSHVHQSFQPQKDAPSYFAQKRNIFNVYFVKVGWFWCTLALTLFTSLVGRGRFAASPHLDPGSLAFFNLWKGPQARAARIAQVGVRWALATFIWMLMTQWCFGPPIIDRGFSLTGGACIAGIENLQKQRLSGDANPAQYKIEEAFTHAACSAAGGKWSGGWDISGHVFLLVLGSGMLWFEILPFVRRWSGILGIDHRVIARPDGSTTTVLEQFGPQLRADIAASSRTSGRSSQQGGTAIPYSIRAYALTFTLAIAVLSWWMLLMTAAFFHTWFEKLMGCAVAFLGLWVVYYMPRANAVVRAVVGMPGL